MLNGMILVTSQLGTVHFLCIWHCPWEWDIRDRTENATVRARLPDGIPTAGKRRWHRSCQIHHRTPLPTGQTLDINHIDYVNVLGWGHGTFGGGTFRPESIRRETFRIESIRRETFRHFNAAVSSTTNGELKQRISSYIPGSLSFYYILGGIVFRMCLMSLCLSCSCEPAWIRKRKGAEPGW